MNCQDVAKLRTPLDAVCQTTDIGCVPILNGKPTCKPQPDELPIAYDKSTSTLWLFSCDTREWIAHKKFTMEELQDLNLENLNNICSILKIGVFYNPGTGTIQGNVSLGEFAEQLLKCLDLETKVVTVTQGENNTIKISIEGLDGLPPTYVKGDNVWFTGTGREGDPVVVHTYDPICKWPVASQSAVDAATTKHLGACLDGQPSRVPYPPKPCEYPQKTQEEVDAATSKNLIACVDGEAVKVPYPKYQPPVCEADQITLEQASSAGTNLTLVGCDNGQVVRIPVSQSGFFDRDYICVPQTIGVPTGPPSQGTGPLRIDCNSNLYVWLCDQSGWLRVHDNGEVLPNLDISDVSNLCEDFRMRGWYSKNSDPCIEDVQFTLQQLVAMIKKCDAANPNVYAIVKDSWRSNLFGCVQINADSRGGDHILYQSRTGQLLKGKFCGDAPVPYDPERQQFGPRVTYAEISVTNPFNVRSLLELHVTCAVNSGTAPQVSAGSVLFYCGPDNQQTYLETFSNHDSEYSCLLPFPGQPNTFTGTDAGIGDEMTWIYSKNEGINFYDKLEAHETKKYYCYYWLMFRLAATEPCSGDQHFHVYMQPYGAIHRHVNAAMDYWED